MDHNMNLEATYGWLLDGIEKYLSNDPEDRLEHFGVKGQKWGVRKAPEQSPEQVKANRIAELQAKNAKLSGDRIYNGAGYVGHYQNKRLSTHPYARAEVRIAALGAFNVAVILAGGNALVNSQGAKASTAQGAKISFALMAGKIAAVRVNEIIDIHQAKKNAEYIAEIRSLDPTYGSKRKPKAGTP